MLPPGKKYSFPIRFVHVFVLFSRCRNVFWKNWMDIFLGVLVMLYLIRGDVTSHLAHVTMMWADVSHVATF